MRVTVPLLNAGVVFPRNPYIALYYMQVYGFHFVLVFFTFFLLNSPKFVCAIAGPPAFGWAERTRAPRLTTHGSARLQTTNFSRRGKCTFCFGDLSFFFMWSSSSRLMAIGDVIVANYRMLAECSSLLQCNHLRTKMATDIKCK